jgi:hypothetical protein
MTTKPAYIALLRGVNVGTAKRVPMAEFRALLSGLGYSDVRHDEKLGHGPQAAGPGR